MKPCAGCAKRRAAAIAGGKVIAAGATRAGRAVMMGVRRVLRTPAVRPRPTKD